MNKGEIDNLLSRHRRYHNGLQVERFIVAGAGITPFGMYRQALREMHGRWTSLRIEVLNIARLQIEIEELEAEDPDGQDQFKRARLAIDLTEKRMRIEESQLAHADGVEEFCRFLLIATELDKQFGSKTDAEREQLELEFHETSLLRDAAFEMAATGTVQGNTLKLMSLMPPKNREHLLNQIQSDPMQALNWARSIEYAVPRVHVPTDLVDEAKRLLLSGASLPESTGELQITA